LKIHKHINAWDYVCSKVVGDLPPMLPSNLIPPKPLLSNYELQDMRLDDDDDENKNNNNTNLL